MSGKCKEKGGKDTARMINISRKSKLHKNEEKLEKNKEGRRD